MRNKLKLVFPCKEMQKEIEEYRQEFFDNGEMEIAGDGGLDRIKDFDEWLKKIKNDTSEKNVENGRIPATMYFAVRKSDKKIVGNVQIRHRLNEKLLKYGGHIGDSIRPSERGKGYATEQIKLALIKCSKLGIDNVLMDCDKDNIASSRTIIKNGGVLENEVEIDGKLVQRYWISLKKRYANRNEKKLCCDTIIKSKSIECEHFKGDVYYSKFINVKDKWIIPCGKCIMDEGYEWLEFYDYNAKIKLTAFYNGQKENMEWYFDIARRIGKDNGVPYEDDLYLDVVVEPTGEIFLIDEDDLKEAFDRFEVNQKEYDMAYFEARNLIKKLEGNVDKLKKFTDNILIEMREL